MYIMMPLGLLPQMLLEAQWRCSVHWWLDSQDPCLWGPLFPVESEVSTVVSRAFIGSPKCREGKERQIPGLWFLLWKSDSISQIW